VVLDLLFGLSLLVAPVSWLVSPLRIPLGGVTVSVAWGIRPLLAPLAIVALRFGVKALVGRGGERGRGLLEYAFFRKLCLSVTATFIFFLVLEQVLVWTGFEAELSPIVIKGEKGEVTTGKAVIRDPELRWKYNPGAEKTGKIINSLGFRDREVDRVKPDGMVRVICMGGSCTAQGKVTYSEYLHAMLTNAPPTAAEWEAFNMGVTGYSSAQGLRVFQKLGRELAPDIVTVYYGWNDHWLAGGRPDSNRMARTMSRRGSKLVEIVRRKRFGQLLVMLVTPGRNFAVRKLDDCLRVPREEYVATLGRFVTEIREAGAVPVVITAPRASKVTKALVRNGQAKSVEEALALHDEYVELTRRVARESGAALLDLAADFLEEGDYEWDLFKGDGVHQEKEGRIRIAGRIYDELVRLAPGLNLPAED